MPSVLIVDDLLTDRCLAGGLLDSIEGLELLHASNGAEAIAQLERRQIDVVITDLQMPEIDGLELVEVMRERFPHVPAILMTAAGSEGLATLALQRGASSYVGKQHLATDLCETTERLLSLATKRKEEAKLFGRIKEVAFEMENDLGLISSLVSWLRSFVRDKDIFSENECIRIGTALDEAILNAFYHGNLEVSSELREEDHNKYHDLAIQRTQESPYNERLIFVCATFLNDRVEFRIRDEGPGFDPCSLPDPTAPEYLQRPSGRGLLLMKAFMDEVHFNDMGNEVRMTKRFESMEQ